MNDAIKKLEDQNRHRENVGQRLNEHGEQLDTIARTVAGNTERLDRIEEKLEKMVTREDHQEVMKTLDRLVTLVEKKDQEVTIWAYAVKATTDRVEMLEKDVKQIKPMVGMH